jgi:hypothetical protein
MVSIALQWLQRARQAQPRATEISFEAIEARYKRQGGTLAEKIFGHDPLDFWVRHFM